MTFIKKIWHVHPIITENLLCDKEAVVQETLTIFRHRSNFLDYKVYEIIIVIRCKREYVVDIYQKTTSI